MGSHFDDSDIRLLELQPDAGLIDWEEICMDYLCTRVGAYTLGICCCLFLLPFLTDAPESRCGYCLLSVTLLVGSEALPSEAAALLPLLLLPVLDVPYNVQLYLGTAVLSKLASIAVVVCAARSALFTRLALLFLRLCGTRHQSILLMGIGVGIFCSFTVLDVGTTVLIVDAVLEASVSVLQNETVQAVHQKVLFEKATQRLPPFRKRQLEKILWPPGTDTATASAVSATAEVGAGQEPPGSSTEEEMWIGFMYTVDKTKQPPVPLYVPPARPPPPPGRSAMRSFRVRSPLRRGAFPRQTTLLTVGGVMIPGESSPPAKPKLKGEDAVFQQPLQAIMKQGVLADVMYWNNTRYVAIYCNLLSSATIAAVVTSIPALHTNKANQYFVDYFHKRFEQDVVSPLMWYSLVTPVIIIPSIAFWVYVSRYTLRKYDAVQDGDAIETINDALRRERARLGRMRPRAHISALLFILWLLRKAIAFFIRPKWELSIPSGLTVDFMIVITMLAMSESMPLVSPTDEVGPRVPWRALLIYGGSACMASAIKHVAFVPWVASQFPEPGGYMLPVQMALTLGAALLTEVLSNEDTLAILLPIAVDMAVEMPCHPLYFALPVTVASSTSLLLPMSSFAIAYVYDRLGVTPWELLLCGLLLKSLVVCTVLFVMSTAGHVVLHWSRVPHWVHRNTTFNVSDI